MGLASQLFRGDSNLEAAAVSDAAHIVPGASGPHVRKIQLALIQLDGARIVPDSMYGPATAAAVLAYKRKRNIVGSYQVSPDNIVGRMTTKRLDEELSALEPANLGRPILTPVMPAPPYRGYRSDIAQFAKMSSFMRLSGGFAFTPPLANVAGPILAKVTPSDLSAANRRCEIPLSGKRLVRVENGVGRFIDTEDRSIARIVNPDNPQQSEIKIEKNPQLVQVQGVTRGFTFLVARTASIHSLVPSLVVEQLPVWHGMPGRTLKIAFNYLRAPAHIQTPKKPGDEDAMLAIINAIYVFQANIFFEKTSAKDVKVPNFRIVHAQPTITIDSQQIFGPDWDKLLANRDNNADVNVYLVRNFDVSRNFPDPGAAGVADLFKAKATGQRDCMALHEADDTTHLAKEEGLILAHELGHCLGVEHAGHSIFELMNHNPTSTIVRSRTAVTMHEHLDKFPPK